VFELGPQAARFLEGYPTKWDDMVREAALCERYMSGLLKPGNFELHLVTARAKSPESARAKVLSKGYGHPAMQLTDQIGVRVITYFASDVDRVAALLRDALDVDDRQSPDKRSALGLREFGYRSVHLVARIRPTHLEMQFRSLASLRMEIQVRSVLEHAWAEIEHEVVYKAGIELPDDMRRRFSAIAGTLELLEMEFLELRRQRGALIEKYAAEYGSASGFEVPLDSARLIGALEVFRPEGLGWRASEAAGQPFPPRAEAACVEALAAAGVHTATELRHAIDSAQFSGMAIAYAASRGTVPSLLSHLTVAVIAVAAKDEGAARAFLAQLAEDVLGAIQDE